jgi:hydrogenase maturation protein HypF
VVAVKGLGGFHLACDATNEQAVAELRVRKERPDKPFAVMVKDLETARRLLDLTEHDEVVLASWQAPIVLVRDRSGLAASVAPGHRRQGAMLPSTPLHHLLLRETDRPLVMTSGNRSEEPICTSNEEARERLAGIADAFLVHDRGIVARYDDSVTRTWRGATVLLRRARSFAPAGLPLSVAVRPTLGCGAELHGTFCLAEEERAFVSQHIGDLETGEAMSAYRDALDRYRRILGIEPELVAHDLHPDFLTTRFAHETGLPAVAVQHHHAHVAAVMAEHGVDGQVIGVALDGFGLGEDGTAWGGEFLLCDLERATRVGHLRPVRLPGGDAAVRHPWRMAIAHAVDAGCLSQAVRLLDPDPKELEVVLGQIESGLASPMTSSAGRLFDAVSALAGVCRESTYEGQPAMLLEQAAEHASREYVYDIAQLDGRLVLDTRPIVRAAVRDLSRDRPAGAVAGRFHRTLAAAILEICREIRGGYGVNSVCLAGGVFQNDLLASDVAVRLSVVGFAVYLPHAVPVGDGGISLGQVVVANARSGG